MSKVNIKTMEPEKKAQLETMVKEGKDSAEVITFFKDEYNLDLTRAQMNNMRFALGMTGKKRKGAKAKRAKQEAIPAAKPIGGGTDSIKKLVDQLQTELEAYSSFVIKKMRKDLVKAIAAARQKLIDVGEEVDPIKEETSEEEI
jgi:hypothetical protein